MTNEKYIEDVLEAHITAVELGWAPKRLDDKLVVELNEKFDFVRKVLWYMVETDEFMHPDKREEFEEFEFIEDGLCRRLGY